LAAAFWVTIQVALAKIVFTSSDERPVKMEISGTVQPAYADLVTAVRRRS
jgi:hypothetical protein